MVLKVIKTEEEFDAAVARIEMLMDAAAGTPEEEELELLGVLIDQYQKIHYPVGLPDPIEAIKYRMEQMSLSRKDMVKYFGSPSKVSEVLNRKRPLSLTMIRALEKGLGIPAEVLVQEPGSTPYHHEPVQDEGDLAEAAEDSPLNESNEKVREAFQIVADYMREGGLALAGVSDAKAAYAAPVEGQVGALPISGALLRICTREELDLSNGQDAEQAVSDWLRVELKRCFDLFHSGDRVHAAQRLFTIEEQTSKSGENSPLFGVIADMVAEMRQMMEEG